MLKSKEYVRYHAWSNLRYHMGIRGEGLVVITMEQSCPCSDWNRGPPEQLSKYVKLPRTCSVYQKHTVGPFAQLNNMPRRRER